MEIVMQVLQVVLWWTAVSLVYGLVWSLVGYMSLRTCREHRARCRRRDR